MVINSRNKTLKFVLLAALVVLLIPTKAQAYIGPGAGFAVAGSLLAVFSATLSAVLALFTWPVRCVIRTIRGRRAFARSRIKKFVVLGLDGMDYALTEKFLAEGKLPNLIKLRQQGCFKQLTTTIPPISPAAWSSFQTGSNPGKHNIFDFLTRDKKSYLPRLSSVDIRSPHRKISLGKYQLTLGKADIRLLRKGKPFWTTLGERGIFSSVIRVPVTFPPEKFYGVQLSGMCVPDLRGTQGMFSFYTSRCDGSGEHIAGESFIVIRNNNTIRAELIGPQNPFRKDNNVLKCPFVVTIKDQNTAKLTISGNTYTVTKNAYTEWIKLGFKAGPGVTVHGICKFLLLSTTSEFELYVTPVNIDPEKPAMPISHPGIFSTYLAKSQGSFATLGLPEDSWALNEKILSDESFIKQSTDVDAERRKMFFDSLDKIKRGLCVCVFDGMDRIQHTFWRDIDEQHPAHKQRHSDQPHNVIEELYRRMDDLVGETLDRCKSNDTVLMIISDHGFNSFRCGVDLNRWLEESGYLKLKHNGRDKKNLTGIDWSETRAFALGLAGIFLNIKGREAQGIVDPENEAGSLRDEIIAKLTVLTDSAKTNQLVIKQVYNAQRIYRGPYKDEAPDLIIGYNKGYRASWEMAIGQVTDRIFHENTKAWSGDHCIDHSLVPGVLFCNRRIEAKEPRLIDIGPTILDMFGVDVPRYMDGKPLSVADADTDNSSSGRD
ncbi:MAG: nucleotide pyrophosphatase [Planctomycetes bacterium RBG_19FT_COMBO_48_8]|nr:MAG: nucleotide pyrophosphatase [Planctomycetes bacterium RBG_19FT_COMBO_48_8]